MPTANSRSLGLLLAHVLPLLAAAAGGTVHSASSAGDRRLLEIDAEISQLEEALLERRAARLSALALEAAPSLRQLQSAGSEESHQTHGSKDPEASPAARPGGRTADLWRTETCVPVLCGDDEPLGDLHDNLHGPSTAAVDDGCLPYEIFNTWKNHTDTVHLSCAGCVPHTCAYGEHDCVPVVCEDDFGDTHGGHSVDACGATHHAEDGLKWWPFLLCCLLATVTVTGTLNKLSSGACFGRSVNPPFTVVMFFFGYLISSLCSPEIAEGVGHEAEAAAAEHHGVAGILIDSVQSWKQAHPHVILFVLLPPLLFEDASKMDFYIFRKVLFSSILLAGPGVGVTMLLTALTTMALFGFAEECVVEVDAETGAQMVSGAREHTAIDGVPVCDPAVNPDWQLQQGPDGGLICLECVEGSHRAAQLPVSVHLLLGGMLAATDPVAVCAVLNDLGCPDKLNYLIAGESLLNDGTAVVAFMVMQSVAGGCDTSALQVLNSLIVLAGGGVLWGVFMAAATYQGIRHLRDPNIEITTLVFATLATFWLAENVLGVSGVLGTVVFGVQTSRTSFLAMDEHTHHANHAFWGEVGYVATSIIFILAGVKSRDKIASFIDTFAEDFHNADEIANVCSAIDTEVLCLRHHACRWDWGEKDVGVCSLNPMDSAVDEEFHVSNQLVLNVLLWAMLGLIRTFVVALLSPLLRKSGYGLTVKEAVVMVWGGLRGAVSLSLALLVDGNHLIGARARETIFLQTTGIVTLTLIINGTTSGMIYKWLQVYPANPYRPALATQGLRSIQAEMMEKVIPKLSSHWFHANADVDTLVKLMPDFSGASMHDGDLVDVKSTSMRSAWMKSKDSMLIPAAPGPTVDSLMVDGALRILAHCAPVNFDVGSFDGGDPSFGAGGAPAPNSYGRIRLLAGTELLQSYETPVARAAECGHSPAWADGVASHDFALPAQLSTAGPDRQAVRLLVDLLDRTFSGIDDPIGECSIDVTDLIIKGDGNVVHQTVELRAASSGTRSPRSPRNSASSSGSAVAANAIVGTVSLAISCMMSGPVGKELKVSLLHGKLHPRRVARALQRRSRRSHAHRAGRASTGEGVLGRTFSNESTCSIGSSVSSAAGHEDESGHGHDDSHHHGPSSMDKLRNIKRWLQESDPSIEHSFAMYDIMLNGMRTSFAHECEGKSISVEAYSKLNAAIGSGLDVNDAQMHQEPTVTNNHPISPLDAVVDYVLDYADNGLDTVWPVWGAQAAADPTDAAFFSHRMLCAEMFLVLITELNDLAAGIDNHDDENGHVAAGAGRQELMELGSSFTTNALQCLQRCQRKLAQMQLAAPNTFRTCHTLLGFNIVASEFHHRVHAYEDQGFFAADIVAAADSAMLGRQRELAQFFEQSPLLVPVVLPLAKATPILGKRLRAHPIFYAFDADRRSSAALVHVPTAKGDRGGGGGDSRPVYSVTNPVVAAMRATLESTWSGSTAPDHDDDQPSHGAVVRQATVSAQGGLTSTDYLVDTDDT